MTPTEELRHMLDERGVEWSDSSDENVLHTTWDAMKCWFNEFPDGWTSWGMTMHGTPEQAVAATVGEECEMRICKRCGVAYELNIIDKGFGKPRFCPNCGYREMHQ